MPDSIELSPDSIKTAAEQGSEQLRALLEQVEGSSDARQAKVERAREALRLLQEEQQDQFSEEERRIIIEASRLIIQDSLDAITEELQGAVGISL